MIAVALVVLGLGSIFAGGHECGAHGGVVGTLALILMGGLLVAAGTRLFHAERRQAEAAARLADLLAWRDTQRALWGEQAHRGRHS
jgi:hypothetical protein